MKKIGDHETLKKVQREKFSPHSDAKPSEVTDVYWIYAIRKRGGNIQS